MDDVAAGHPYVFISYASADREQALPIVAALRGAGIACWIDQHGIEGGANWGLRIAEAIEGCAAFVLMSSMTSLASRNVRQEIALAWKYSKPYLPLLLDTTPVPKDIEYWLETAQWIEVLDHPRESWLAKVVAALGHLTLSADRSSIPVNPAVARSESQLPSLISIPTPLTALIGRQTAIAEIVELLRSERLVTLTGPGGTGKTRLAIAVGHASSAFFDGVAFISLAAVRDPGLVIPAIANALGIRESADEPIRTTLARVIGEREQMLALDNLEQVIDAAADISALLVACPQLRVLATSRSPLHISGEREYQVLPLTTPEAGDRLERLAGNAAVALFVDRARSVKREFALTTDNAAAVAAICRRLDGLPLALELAAARVKLMTPQSILARLQRPLAVLTGGARDLPERQQTIRATIQWSYDLLPRAEQRLFRRLAVFVGGWTLDATEAVGATDDADVLDRLISLVEKSLVTHVEQPDGEARFIMLVAIREFGLEQLAEHAETIAAHDAFVAYFLRLTDEADLNNEDGSSFVDRLNWMEREFDNVRIAIAWANERDPETVFRLLLGLWHLWYTRGYLADGRRFLHLVLDRWPDAALQFRAQALDQAGTLAAWQADIAGSTAFHEESLRLYRAIDDQPGICSALFGMGRAAHFGGDFVAASEHYEQSLALARAINDQSLIASATGNLAMVVSQLGDFERALELNEESLDIDRARGSLLGIQIGTTDRADIMIEHGDFTEARRLAAESLRLAQEIGMMRKVAESIEMLGILAGASDDRERAARLIGASHRLRQTLNVQFLPVLVASIEQRISAIRDELGSQRFDALAAEGAALTTDDAIALALQSADD